ncbi:hypothetical protein RIF29_28032 [Crotalaria pallida]|uniref:COX assembly mitochondrial protein n=1 Tax=Crotalaria pallida TaxID=3830 RepID=A0AAN9I1K5_CROPI
MNGEIRGKEEGSRDNAFIVHSSSSPTTHNTAFETLNSDPTLPTQIDLVVTCEKMHPPLTLHKHPMCAEIIEQFQKCHIKHPIAKFFGECTDLKIKLDRCFRQEKALKRKANFDESKKFKEQLHAFRKENATNSSL